MGELGWASRGRGGAGLTHFRKASWLLRKGKKEGSQISPWSRQVSVQALPAAASQARSECAGGQAPGATLAFCAHSRWVALGARMKGLCGARVPEGAGPGAAQKSCPEESSVRRGNGPQMPLAALGAWLVITVMVTAAALGVPATPGSPPHVAAPHPMGMNMSPAILQGGTCSGPMAGQWRPVRVLSTLCRFAAGHTWVRLRVSTPGPMRPACGGHRDGTAESGSFMMTPLPVAGTRESLALALAQHHNKPSLLGPQYPACQVMGWNTLSVPNVRG